MIDEKIWERNRYVRFQNKEVIGHIESYKIIFSLLGTGKMYVTNYIYINEDNVTCRTTAIDKSKTETVYDNINYEYPALIETLKEQNFTDDTISFLEEVVAWLQERRKLGVINYKMLDELLKNSNKYEFHDDKIIGELERHYHFGKKGNKNNYYNLIISEQDKEDKWVLKICNNNVEMRRFPLKDLGIYSKIKSINMIMSDYEEHIAYIKRETKLEERTIELIKTAVKELQSVLMQEEKERENKNA